MAGLNAAIPYRGAPVYQRMGYRDICDGSGRFLKQLDYAGQSAT
jgi:hypothetical protein